jgi:hypothetical protein
MSVRDSSGLQRAPDVMCKAVVMADGGGQRRAWVKLHVRGTRVVLCCVSAERAQSALVTTLEGTGSWEIVLE